MKKKYVILLAVLAGFVILGLAGLEVYSRMEANLEGLADLTIPNVDLSQAKDGVYTGSYSAFPVAVELEVTIVNHAITDIVLRKHQNGQGADAEVIPARVIEAQSLDVDIVSGATYSSKVILKAIEAALKEAVH